jgi:hypothetical protein
VKSAVRVALRAIDSDPDERLAVGEIPDDGKKDQVADPLELDMSIDLDDEGEKGGSS